MDRPGASPAMPDSLQPLSVDRRSAPMHFTFVDALRGWAILGVLLIHASLHVNGFSGRIRGFVSQGQYGVQLFFVISAFTLFWSLRSRTRVDRSPLLAFFTRRICRIGPLFWVGMAFYGYRLMHGLDLVQQKEWAPAGVHLMHFVTSALFLHGWYPTTINSIVPGGWSIAAEFSFYLTIPFLFARIRTLSAALWLTVISAALVGILQGPAVTHLSHHFPTSWEPLIKDFVFYSFPTQFPVFCLGMSLYFLLLPNLTEHAAKPTISNNNSMALLLVLAGVICVFGAPPRHVFVAAAFAAIAYGLSVRPFVVAVNPITRFIGTISYSGYIWHFWIIGQVGAWVRKHVHMSHLSTDANCVMQFVAIYVGTAVGIFPIAVASYYLIERPGQNFGKWIIRRFGWGSVPRSIEAALPITSPVMAG